jgi:hypothetical protein
MPFGDVCPEAWRLPTSLSALLYLLRYIFTSTIRLPDAMPLPIAQSGTRQRAARHGETSKGLSLRCMIYYVPMHWKDLQRTRA